MQNKSVKEILELMLNNQDLFDFEFGGLCTWVYQLRDKDGLDILSFDEKQLMLWYIKDNRPSMFSSIDAFRYRNRCYYWPSGKIEPRIKWIKQHIKKLSND